MFSRAVEEGKQLVVLGLSNGVIFVGVTTRAGECHAQQDGTKSFRTVEVVFGLKLLSNGAAFRS